MTYTPALVNGVPVDVDLALSLVALWDEQGNLVGTRPATDAELASAGRYAAGKAARDARDAANGAARTALTDAIALAALYPAPTPEETALIDAQVASALASYRALDNPPADVVSLAAAVVAWRTEVAL